MQEGPLSAQEIKVAGQDISEARRWDELAEKQPEVIRQGLVRAEQHRQAGDDPGDAFLDGVRWHQAVTNAREETSAFTEEWETALTEEQAPPKRRRALLGTLFAVWALRNS